MYLAADPHLVTVNAPTFVAKVILTFELTKLKFVTASAIHKQNCTTI